MTKTDMPALTERLNALAETFDRKPLGEKAVITWFQALREFPWPQVSDALDLVARTKTRFPAIADVFNPLSDRAITDREAAAVEDKRRMVHQTARAFSGPSEEGRAALAMCKQLLAQDKPSPRAWADDILDRFLDDRPMPNGNPVSDLQARLACEALGHDYREVKALRDDARTRNREQVPA